MGFFAISFYFVFEGTTRRETIFLSSTHCFLGEISKQLAEYKFRAQKAEQDVATLQANVARLESQVIRYKSAAEVSEKSEEALKAEKRKLQREVTNFPIPQFLFSVASAFLFTNQFLQDSFSFTNSSSSVEYDSEFEGTFFLILFLFCPIFAFGFEVIRIIVVFVFAPKVDNLKEQVTLIEATKHALMEQSKRLLNRKLHGVM